MSERYGDRESIPDFDALALSRPWPRGAWRRAWVALDIRIPWEHLVALVDRTHTHPEVAANRLTRALVPSTLTRTSITRVLPPGEGRA